MPEGRAETLDFTLARQQANKIILGLKNVPEGNYRLQCKAGLTTENGDIPSIDQRALFSITHDLTFRKITAETSLDSGIQIRASFNNSIDAAKAAAFISIDPKVEYTLSSGSDYYYGFSGNLRLRGRFIPGQVYRVTFREGMPSLNDCTLKNTVSRTVRIPDFPASLQWIRNGTYCSPLSSLTLPIKSVNCNAFEVKVSRIFENNIVHYFAQREYSWRAGYALSKHAAPELSHVYSVNGLLNEPTETQVSLYNFYDDPKGIYFLSACTGRADASRLLVITDQGITAKKERDGYLVRVSSLRHATPIEAAAVSMYSLANQKLAEAITDADGLARLKLPPLLGNAEAQLPFLILSRNGDDIGVLNLKTSEVHEDALRASGSFSDTDAEAFVYCDRGIYRPGGRLNTRLIVRDRTLSAPIPFPIELRVIQPDGRTCHTAHIMLSEFGSATLQWELPSYIPFGRYSLEARIPGGTEPLGEGSFLLEDFVPPQIRVTAATATNRIAHTEETFAFNIGARYLFGRAAQHLPVQAGVNYSSVSFRPDGYDEYLFGDREARGSASDRALKPLRLDADGTAVYHLEAPGSNPRALPLRLLLRATVTEPSGRAVSAYHAVTIDPLPYYLGVKTFEENLCRAGETNAIQFAAVCPDGTVAELSGPVQVELFSCHWNSTVLKQEDGSYQYRSTEEKVIVNQFEVSLSNGVGTCSLAVPAAGSYLLRATCSDRSIAASTRFYATTSGDQWISGSRERPDQIDLQLDKTNYRAGDTARLQIRAPFSGTALMTLESDRVLESRLVELHENSLEVEIPVKESYGPNIYCALSLIRPVEAEEVWSTHRATGRIALQIDRPASHLIPQILAPAKITPASTLSVPVKIMDANGVAAGGCEVSVAVVDEALCMLTAFKTPAPDAFFLRLRRPFVKTYDLYSELFELIEEVGSGQASHTAGDAAGLRLKQRLSPIQSKRFKPLALWETLKTDENGTAVAQFELPEFSGELRIMAVANSRTATGATEASVKVARNIVVQNGLPRFLAPGDVCNADFTVFNTTATNQTVSISLDAQGPAAFKEKQLSAHLAPDETLTLTRQFSAANMPGVAEVKLTVDGGGEIAKDSLSIPIRPASSSVSQSFAGTLNAGETALLHFPRSWMPATCRGVVHINADPLLKLGGALNDLMQYPYGCLEQTVSKSFPLLYLADLAAYAQPGMVEKEDVSDLIQAGIDRILSMQARNGLFCYWPNSDSIYVWGSIYATHFLIEADAAGYAVPTEALRRAVAAASKQLEEYPNDAEDARNDDSVRAYICHVLALYGRPSNSWNNRLLEQLNVLPCDARLHLASALIDSGQPAQALPIIEQSGVAAIRYDNHPGAILRSRTRDIALKLLALLSVSREHTEIKACVRQLFDAQKNGYWSSTQENALALLALGKYAQCTPPDSRPFAGSVTQNQVMHPFSHEAPFKYEIKEGLSAVITITNQGPGTCYYNANLSGIPTRPGPSVARCNGIKVTSTLLDPDSGKPRANSVHFLQGDRAVIKIEIDTFDASLDAVVIEDLLPAGFEIENPRLKTSEQFRWIKKQDPWVIHQEMRDDRMLLFTAGVTGRKTYYYAVRAVCPGRYTYPALRASCMYAPDIECFQPRSAITVEGVRP
jgi:uncharacterized protein YfaS (alpha-2-macroglobulin family)